MSIGSSIQMPDEAKLRLYSELSSFLSDIKNPETLKVIQNIGRVASEQYKLTDVEKSERDEAIAAIQKMEELQVSTNNSILEFENNKREFFKAHEDRIAELNSAIERIRQDGINNDKSYQEEVSLLKDQREKYENLIKETKETLEAGNSAIEEKTRALEIREQKSADVEKTNGEREARNTSKEAVLSEWEKTLTEDSKKITETMKSLNINR